MESIHNDFQTTVAPDKVFEAISTQEGYRGWWTHECDVDPKVSGKAEFRFNGGKVAMIFRFDQLDRQAVRLTCTDHRNNEEWVGTTLRFDLKPSGQGTEVQFDHEGWNLKSECYNQCVQGWDHFMKSLKSYVETGTGSPF